MKVVDQGLEIRRVDTLLLIGLDGHQDAVDQHLVVTLQVEVRLPPAQRTVTAWRTRQAAVVAEEARARDARRIAGGDGG
jgi:hypothetical protein